MDYQISREGKIIGAYEYSEVIKRLEEGSLRETDFYWRKGMSGWNSLKVFKLEEKNSPSPVQANSSDEKGVDASSQESLFADNKIDKLLGKVGSFLIILSVFTPFAGILHSPSLIEGDWGKIFLVSGIIGLFLSFTKHLKFLLYVGLIPLAFYVFIFAWPMLTGGNINGRHSSIGFFEVPWRAGFYFNACGTIILLFVGISAQLSKSVKSSFKVLIGLLMR